MAAAPDEEDANGAPAVDVAEDLPVGTIVEGLFVKLKPVVAPPVTVKLVAVELGVTTTTLVLAVVVAGIVVFAVGRMIARVVFAAVATIVVESALADAVLDGAAVEVALPVPVSWASNPLTPA